MSGALRSTDSGQPGKLTRLKACRSRAVWANECQPILQAAGLSVEQLETQRPRHATEMARKLSVQDIDAIVCVGGDGTMSEILQVMPRGP